MPFSYFRVFFIGNFDRVGTQSSLESISIQPLNDQFVSVGFGGKGLCHDAIFEQWEAVHERSSQIDMCTSFQDLASPK